MHLDWIASAQVEEFSSRSSFHGDFQKARRTLHENCMSRRCIGVGVRSRRYTPPAGAELSPGRNLGPHQVRDDISKVIHVEYDATNRLTVAAYLRERTRNERGRITWLPEHRRIVTACQPSSGRGENIPAVKRGRDTVSTQPSAVQHEAPRRPPCRHRKTVVGSDDPSVTDLGCDRTPPRPNGWIDHRQHDGGWWKIRPCIPEDVTPRPDITGRNVVRDVEAFSPVRFSNENGMKNPDVGIVEAKIGHQSDRSHDR